MQITVADDSFSPCTGYTKFKSVLATFGPPDRIFYSVGNPLIPGMMLFATVDGGAHGVRFSASTAPIPTVAQVLADFPAAIEAEVSASY
jgi:hypothetical protein